MADIIHLQPTYGIRMVQSRLKARGFVLQRERVKESMHRVNPSGMQMRLRTCLHRRQYSVPTPNYLWHMMGITSLSGGGW